MNSRIKGLNTTTALSSNHYLPCSIKVWKGTKKRKKTYQDKITKEIKTGYFYGDDLPFEYRLEILNQAKPSQEITGRNLVKSSSTVSTILKKYYGSNCREDHEGLYLKYLNIIFYSSDPQKTFFSAMAIYDKKTNHIKHFCNQETIFRKFEGKNGTPCESNEPCHKKKNKDCPLGCKPYGKLYFEILELRLCRLSEYCTLTVSGVNDVVNIAKYLDRFYAESPDLRFGDFYSSRTQRFKVFLLNKQPKLNNYKKQMNLVRLQYHPIWLDQQENYLAAIALQKANLPVPNEILEAIYGEALIPNNSQVLEAINVNLLSGSTESDLSQPLLAPASLKINISDQDIDQARQIWRTEGWQKESLLYLLRSYFQIEQLKELRYLSREKFNRFIELLRSQTIKEIYNLPIIESNES